MSASTTTTTSSAPTDREAIAGLVHRYSDAVACRDIAQWTSCWAADATWSLGPDRTAAGRDNCVAMLTAALGGLEAVVQNTLNGEVHTLDGDTAAARWYIMEHFKRTSGETGVILGHYDDTYRREPGGWVFASRDITFHYIGPSDLSGTWFNRFPA